MIEGNPPNRKAEACRLLQRVVSEEIPSDAVEFSSIHIVFVRFMECVLNRGNWGVVNGKRLCLFHCVFENDG